jgi:polyphosphate kinase
VGLKTHSKTLLVVRQEGENIRRYFHIGTGNYNSKTANLYTDLGLMSCREDLGADLTDLFNYLTGYSCQDSYRKLLVSPINMRARITALIQREIEHCQNGNQGHIIAKMNALVDPQIIASLYKASLAGVQIDLIVRGICCLCPGIPKVSENIRVISIIGRFLEHSRIFHFHNNGQNQVYIGSADWMTRNLDHRVEAVVPVEDNDIVQNLQKILKIMLSDNRQAWDLQPDGSYIQRSPNKNEPERSAQNILIEMMQ